MAVAEPDNRPVIPETNGLKANYSTATGSSSRTVPVVGWTADGVALVPTEEGKLVRVHVPPNFFGLTGAPMPDMNPRQERGPRY
jgi:hypothetical protein